MVYFLIKAEKLKACGAHPRSSLLTRVVSAGRGEERRPRNDAADLSEEEMYVVIPFLPLPVSLPRSSVWLCLWYVWVCLLLQITVCSNKYMSRVYPRHRNVAQCPHQGHGSQSFNSPNHAWFIIKAICFALLKTSEDIIVQKLKEISVLEGGWTTEIGPTTTKLGQQKKSLNLTGTIGCIFEPRPHLNNPAAL